VNGLVKDTAHFTMGVVTDSTSYIMMIDNPVKFKNFINANLNDDVGVQLFQYSFYKTFKISENNPANLNGRRFLTAMNHFNTGLKIFRGNVDLSQFSPVKISEDGLSVVPDPCN
jgi:hypothetical protein